jgi:GntR family carbon starvation induced transcriptional regulator
LKTKLLGGILPQCEKGFIKMLERLRQLPSEVGSGAEDMNLDVPLTQIAWQRIRDDIICGKLRPNARLRIGKLRDLYGIGASPLREALSRLVPDGFVNSIDRRGFLVAPISLRELRELTDVRKLIEREAARLSLATGDDEWESRLVAALYRMSKFNSRPVGKMSQAMKEWETLNEAFHEALMSGSSSILLLNFRRTAYFYAKRYLRVCLSATAIRDLQKDHKALADAAIARDATKLQNLIEARLERTYQKIAASGKL